MKITSLIIAASIAACTPVHAAEKFNLAIQINSSNGSFKHVPAAQSPMSFTECDIERTRHNKAPNAVSHKNSNGKPVMAFVFKCVAG